mmetsp:Transcript_30950/g.63237  ORF Transcript_30950/g.63237 Transcript_30950/m.63237 type:complete len:386 (-) Transcript_30950:559-1716(-)|eukprot:CAMPEP_0183303508 /NCGR_PEP_ID=MMETSP0160_2-20130417/8917_1 /TAXON_ID=2839 ORGANISM="Odontella Sinensis, Strain Grunow 1884" /NCGR_SAMPLE_ID=MMETSP0160_2 /ASSEMBLY_ACC=CAM_ASM_000250 /LENGTH=385 /DNA_ID=CAMNT_0025466421 /DNA_START=351 /DNA_END=1508 /DNA_ORIENTATION=+
MAEIATNDRQPRRRGLLLLAVTAAAFAPLSAASATPYGPHGISLGLGRGAGRRRRRAADSSSSSEYAIGDEGGASFDDDYYGYEDEDDGFGGGGGGGGRRSGGFLVRGTGREFDVFDTRGGDGAADVSTARPPSRSFSSYRAGASSSSYSSSSPGGKRRRSRSPPASSSASATSGRRSGEGGGGPGLNLAGALRSVRDNLPRIQLRMEPTTTLKIRKTFNVFRATVLRLGADFNYQLGVWQFKSSWEDTVIGGKLSLAGRELQLAKTWRISVDKSSLGAAEDFVTSVRFRAAMDLSTLRAYARLGFRTERVSPINVYEGFTFVKRFPLDGTDRERIKLEVKANLALPEPEIEYTTDGGGGTGGRTFVGLGDVEVNVDELNLLFDF